MQAKGDIDIDEHHTVEDVGIVMGKALHRMRQGERRGSSDSDMLSATGRETFAQVTVDLSGRPYLVYNVNLPDRKIKTFDPAVRGFFPGFRHHGGGLNLHINLHGRNSPHYGSHLQGVGAGAGPSHVARKSGCQERFFPTNSLWSDPGCETGQSVAAITHRPRKQHDCHH